MVKLLRATLAIHTAIGCGGQLEKMRAEWARDTCKSKSLILYFMVSTDAYAS